MIKICKKCKIQFDSFKSSKRTFCGKKCYWEHLSITLKGKRLKENSPFWKGGYKESLPHCLDCNKKLSYMKGIRCMKCHRNTQRGENSCRWISNRDLLKKVDDRRSSAYDDWRKQVFKRDSWKCKISNQDCAGRIEAHHILSWRDYEELRYEINNGITLCLVHHPRKRAEERLLAPDFQRMVSVI